MTWDTPSVVIDQQLADYDGGSREEVVAVMETLGVVSVHPQPRLVNQSSGLQRGSLPLVDHPRRRQLPQFLVH